jgi:uncharacterized membrane protein
MFFNSTYIVGKKIKVFFDNIFSDKKFFQLLPYTEYQRAINMTLTEMLLKSESVSSVINDTIDKHLYKQKIENCEESIDILDKMSFEQARKSVLTTLFDGGLR